MRPDQYRDGMKPMPSGGSPTSPPHGPLHQLFFVRFRFATILLVPLIGLEFGGVGLVALGSSLNVVALVYVGLGAIFAGVGVALYMSVLLLRYMARMNPRRRKPA
jgi:hypothetical protein